MPHRGVAGVEQRSCLVEGVLFDLCRGESDAGEVRLVRLTAFRFLGGEPLNGFCFPRGDGRLALPLGDGALAVRLFALGDRDPLLLLRDRSLFFGDRSLFDRDLCLLLGDLPLSDGFGFLLVRDCPLFLRDLALRHGRVALTADLEVSDARDAHHGNQQPERHTLEIAQAALPGVALGSRRRDLVEQRGGFWGSCVTGGDERLGQVEVAVGVRLAGVL